MSFMAGGKQDENMKGNNNKCLAEMTCRQSEKRIQINASTTRPDFCRVLLSVEPLDICSSDVPIDVLLCGFKKWQKDLSGKVIE